MLLRTAILFLLLCNNAVTRGQVVSSTHFSVFLGRALILSLLTEMDNKLATTITGRSALNARYAFCFLIMFRIVLITVRYSDDPFHWFAN